MSASSFVPSLVVRTAAARMRDLMRRHWKGVDPMSTRAFWMTTMPPGKLAGLLEEARAVERGEWPRPPLSAYLPDQPLPLLLPRGSA